MAGNNSVVSNQSLTHKSILNIKNMRFGLSELSGALGDLGTFIPLTAALSIVNGMDIAVILLIAGIFNVVTGIIFGLPIPVQPMKAIAAVAIAEGLNPSETMAAGLLVGLIIFLLGATNLTEKLKGAIPKVVVRGIQLGVGAKLFIKGVEFILSTPIWGVDSLIAALILVAGVGLLLRFKKIPTALLLFIFGLIVVVISNSQFINEMSYSLINLQFNLPASADWLNGFIYGAVPQLPLTLLNSVIAVCVLSGDLFPGKEIKTNRMAMSVGVMNLVGCWFGGMPMCHGSGGLAGQYRFGARTGGSVVILGVVKIIVGLFFGLSAMWLLNAYPLSVLGVMLLFAGIELARPACDQISYSLITIVLITASGIVFINTMVGFLAGMLLYIILRRI